MVIRPNHRLGNTLLLTPLLAELERYFPGAEVHIVCGTDATTPLLARFATVRRIFTFPRNAYRHPRETLRTLLALSRARYDLVIDPVLRSRSARFLLGRITTRAGIGFAWRRDRLLTHAIDASGAPPHLAQQAVYALRRAMGGTDCIQPSYPTLNMRLTTSELAHGRAQLRRVLGDGANSRPVLAVYAHATGAKNFPQQWWLRVLGAFGERDPSCRIVEIVPHFGRVQLGGRFPFYYSTDLRDLAAFIAASSLFLSADGGIMHLGCAAGARTVGLFCVTDPKRYGPIGNRSFSILTTGRKERQIAELLAQGAGEVPHLNLTTCASAARVY